MENNKLDLGLFDDVETNESKTISSKQETSKLEQLQRHEACENKQSPINEQNVQNSVSNSRLNSFINENNVYSQQRKKTPNKLYKNLGNFNFNRELRIKIFGVGGAGNNMVQHMATNSSINNDSLFAINTDYQVLRKMPDDINVILIGDKITNGYGSGSDPEIGKKAAIESEDIIREILEDTDLLFIVSGMGKGTGTGASPIIAKIAKEMGIMTLALANLPSISNEGTLIYNKGQKGLDNLRKEVSGILTISNEKLFNETNPNISLERAFQYANSVITNVIFELINLVTVPSQINVDFNDVKTFFREPIVFQLNTFELNSHNKIEDQINEQLSNQIYQDNITGAKKAIVNFKVNPNVNRDLVNNLSSALTKITKNNELETTFALDYFDTIECARVSILFAMENCDKEDISLNHYSHSNQTIKPSTIQLDIINTKNEFHPERIKTIELPQVNQADKTFSANMNSSHAANNEVSRFNLSQQQQVNSQMNEYMDILFSFSELNDDIKRETGNGMNVQSYYDQYNHVGNVDSVASYTIPTKRVKFEQNNQQPKTIQFEHKTKNKI